MKGYESESATDIWPYVLPLPKTPTEQYKVLVSVFGSDVALQILKRASVEKRIYQRDLIRELDYSNKTIINTLKKLVALNILSQGMEKDVVKGKTVWTKWYSPTPLGKWIAFLMAPPKEISKRDTEAIVKELFELYSKSIVKLCLEYGISTEDFRESFDSAFLSEAIRVKRITKPLEVLVYGSAAQDLVARVDRFPHLTELTFVKDFERMLGGSGVNVAVGLRKLGVRVGFSGKIGSDVTGRLLLEKMSAMGVSVSDVSVMEGGFTPLTVVLVREDGEKRCLVLGGEKTAYSISSPAEVNWRSVEGCRIVYIGEVFLEIGELLSRYAKSKGKTVIYRPSVPYLEYGLHKLTEVLKNTDFLFLNDFGWNVLTENSQVELKSPADLLDFGIEKVIVTRGSGGCEIYTEESPIQLPAYQVKPVDTTGAGDAFVAGFIKALLEGYSTEDAGRYALAVSSKAITRKGAWQGIPTHEQVEELLSKKDEFDDSGG